MAKFKSDKVFDLPNGVYSAIWVGDRITFLGYGHPYVFFTQRDRPGSFKTEMWEGSVELMNGIANVDDTKGWISHYQPLDSTYNPEKGYWICHGK